MLTHSGLPALIFQLNSQKAIMFFLFPTSQKNLIETPYTDHGNTSQNSSSGSKKVIMNMKKKEDNNNSNNNDDDDDNNISSAHTLCLVLNN